MINFQEEDDKVKAFCAKLIAEQTLLVKQYKKEFEKDSFRLKVDKNLDAVGMELLTHIYSEYYSIALKQDFESVLEKDGEFYSNNLGMSRGAMALLSILWCMLILPKREKQTQKQQSLQMKFLRSTPRPLNKEEQIYVSEDLFTLEYSQQLFGKGSKMRFGGALNEIVRLGFVRRYNKRLYEGALLDTLIDYGDVMDHIESGLFQDIAEKVKTDLVQIETTEKVTEPLDKVDKNDEDHEMAEDVSISST